MQRAREQARQKGSKQAKQASKTGAKSGFFLFAGGHRTQAKRITTD
jgi:hypothetical protein